MSFLSEFSRLQRQMDRMSQAMRHPLAFGVEDPFAWEEDFPWDPFQVDRNMQRRLQTNQQQQQQPQQTIMDGKAPTSSAGDDQRLTQAPSHDQVQKSADPSSWLSPFSGGLASLTPRLNIESHPTHYVVTADLPGLTKENLNVELNKDTGVMTISGHTEHSTVHSSEDKEEDQQQAKGGAKDEKQADGTSPSSVPSARGPRWVRRERSTGSFSRSVRLPTDVQKDGQGMQAKLEHGLLTITVARQQADKAEHKKKDNTKVIAIE